MVNANPQRHAVAEAHEDADTPVFESDQAKQAFETIRAELEALPQFSLITPRVDLQKAAAITHSIARRDLASPRRERFEGLSNLAGFEFSTLERLITLSLACWYARARQLEALALRQRAIVRPEVATQATELRARMLRVLEYHFHNGGSVAERLAFIRSGAGYQDLANDLYALAELYETPSVRDVIQEDTRHYDESDMSLAREVADQIFAGLGLRDDDDAQVWTSMAQRAWTALLAAYDEVRAAGRFLFRDEPTVGEDYPSLITRTRARPQRGPTIEAEHVDTTHEQSV